MLLPLFLRRLIPEIEKDRPFVSAPERINRENDTDDAECAERTYDTIRSRLITRHS